jgi:lia operon protein LiaG
VKTKFNIKVILIPIGVIVIMSILGLGTLQMFREINEEKHFTVEAVNDIEVTMSSTPVHIIRTDASDKINVHYYGKSMQELKLTSEINNKTLVVAVKRKIDGPIPEDMFLDIYIPEDYNKNLFIKISSGVVKMDSLNLASFTLNTSSGGLEAEPLNVGRISINTSSGKVNIQKLEAKDLGIIGSSSAINIDECIAGKAKIVTSSGSITLKNCDGNFDFNGTAGNILVAYKEFENQTVNIATTSGRVTLELPSTAEFLIDAKTVTGRIQSDFPINAAGNANNKQIVGQVGTKRNTVLLQTSTGSIKILKG